MLLRLPLRAAALLWLSLWAAGAAQAQAQASAPPQAPAASVPQDTAVRLRVVGGLASLNQYLRHEQPFWTQELPRLSQGRLTADIVPFDRAGIQGHEMLRLVQLGAMPFATVLLSVNAANDPLLGAPDLAGQNADIATLRRTVAAFRPSLEKLLRERYSAELLAIYTYPAQVVFCRRPFDSLGDLAGRKVRTSSPTQSDLVEALGGLPVRTAFAEQVAHMKSGNVDCAITGAMSGHSIGLHEAASHVHTMAVNWGLSVFVAHSPAWKALPAAHQSLLRRELPKLEQAVWAEAERETEQGLACVSGAAACPSPGHKGRLTVVRASVMDEKRRQDLFANVVLPRWVQRCGSDCARLWNDVLAGTVGTTASAPR